MPIWNIEYVNGDPAANFKFCPIGIIVRKRDEADMVADILIKHYEDERRDYASRIEQAGGKYYVDNRLFYPNSILCTKIVVLDEFSETEQKELKIETIINGTSVISIYELLKKKYNVDYL